MSDVIGYEVGKRQQNHRVCRVAYTLNNEQPVVCTIIGEEPLFYMDYEYEDDDAFDAAELNILEAELLNLEKEIKSFERFTEGFSLPAEAVFEDFGKNADDVSVSVEKSSASTEALVEILSQSRVAGAYLAFAQEHKVELALSSQTAEGEYNRNSGKILVNKNLDQADQVLIAARELRRHWQHRQGALIHPLMFHPDSAILVNRVQKADLAASVVRVAWELQLSSYKDAWERLENSSMADLARAFAREAFVDFRTINNGQANAAVFEAWFLSERCRTEDRGLIQGMLADYQGYVFGQEESQNNITPALIAALGEMPFGKNYLSAHVNTIMNDPIFTDVRDRSNANFLWFIKFEKSFRETEQELQSLESNQADDIAQAAFLKENNKFKTGTIDENFNRSDAQVIELFAHSKYHEDRGSRSASAGSNGAEIIYLR